MKSTHRIVGILLTIVILSSLVGCSLNEVRFNMDENRYREAKLEVLLDALQDQDLEAVKGLFSQVAIDTVGEKEIEDGINHLFAVFKGSVITYKMYGGGVSTEIKDGKKHVSTFIVANVETDVSKYEIRCYDHISNAIDRNNVGISHIIILSQDEWLKYGNLNESFVGVFRQDYYSDVVDSSLSREGMMDVIHNSLQNKDVSAIQNLFSKATINNVGEESLMEDIEYLFSGFNESIEAYELSTAHAVMNVVNGGLVIEVEGIYIVTTETEDYIVFFSGYSVNQVSPEETGLEQLKVVREADWPDYSDYDPKFRGVLRVD